MERAAVRETLRCFYLSYRVRTIWSTPLCYRNYVAAEPANDGWGNHVGGVVSKSIGSASVEFQMLRTATK